MDETSVMICMPTSWPDVIVVPGSAKRQCSKCQCEVWLTRESQKVLEGAAGRVIVCVPCFGRDIDVSGAMLQMPTAGQLKEAVQTMRSHKQN